MHPWTTPPTSWPTPPQPANPSSTWPPQSTSMASTPRPPMTWPTTAPLPTSTPQPAFTIELQQFVINSPHSSGTTPTPVEHLFGQPSALHPTWPSSTSPQQTASTMPPLSFASLATAPHAVPAPHLVHATTSPLSPDTTSLHTNLPVFATPMAPTFPTTWPTAPPPSNLPTTPPTPLPGSPYPPRVLQSPPLATTTSTIPPAAPQFTEVKAAPKVPSGKKLDKLRRSAAKASSASPPAAPPEPASTPPSSISAEVATLGSTTQQLVESVRLIQAQQQTILDSQRLHEQRQQLLHQDLPPIGSTPPTPSPTLTPPTPIPTTIPPPAAKARPTEPTAPDHNTTSSIPPAPNPRSSTPPSRRPRSRTRRSRSLRSTTHSHRRPPPHRRADRPRSPLPRHRSSTKHPKDRRTPSPYRRRSPPRRRSPTGPRRHRSNPPPRSRTPLRHPQGHEVILRPAARPSDPNFIPTPDADDSWGDWNHSHYPTDHHRDSTRPRSPVGPPPPEPSSTPPTHVTAPLGAVAFRLPDGDSENSDAAEAFSISQFDKNDIEVSELNAAAADPHRVRCLTELDPNHTVPLRTVLDQPTKILFNNFVDEMFSQLAKPYRTMNDDLVFIKASQATVMNIARAFAQARLLDLNLARRTQAFYVEPENLLTITVPTGLPKKPIYRGEHAGTYMSYHKTSWESVAKILAEDCIRPATWTKNEAGIPTQYPCYGFFGMSSEIADIDELQAYAVKLCTSQLYKIGKGQNPSGLLAICRSPKCMRALSGGNDQIQRLCNLQGIAKGKDGATAMNSSAASICYVASTHSVFQGLITRTPPAVRTSTVTAPSELPANPPADPEPPAPSTTVTDLPEPSDPPSHTHSRSATSHRETTDRATSDYNHHHWSNNSSWRDPTNEHRGNYSSYREGRSRDQHREGYSRSRSSAYDYSKSRW